MNSFCVHTVGVFTKHTTSEYWNLREWPCNYPWRPEVGCLVKTPSRAKILPDPKPPRTLNFKLSNFKLKTFFAETVTCHCIHAVRVDNSNRNIIIHKKNNKTWQKVS